MSFEERQFGWFVDWGKSCRLGCSRRTTKLHRLSALEITGFLSKFLNGMTEQNMYKVFVVTFKAKRCTGLRKEWCQFFRENLFSHIWDRAVPEHLKVQCVILHQLPLLLPAEVGKVLNHLVAGARGTYVAPRAQLQKNNCIFKTSIANVQLPHPRE